MLTGVKLGKAIESALILKKISKAEVARLFGVKPPSVAGWINTGRISKPNFEKLRQFLADVVGPEHWGLTADLSKGANTPSSDSRHLTLSEDEYWLVASYRKASKEVRTGMLAFARLVLPERPVALKQRTGT